jgi:ketosteroid isomerase-like protein
MPSVLSSKSGRAPVIATIGRYHKTASCIHDDGRDALVARHAGSEKEPAVQRASERVQAFFDQYESNIGGSDPAAIAAQYGDSFVFAGPQGAQAVRRDDFVKVLPKRQAFVTSAGLQSTSLVALEEASVDDRCVLVKAQWRLQFGSATAPVSALDVSSTYLLQQQPDGLRIVFQLDHDDLMKRVEELGLV